MVLRYKILVWLVLISISSNIQANSVKNYTVIWHAPSTYSHLHTFPSGDLTNSENLFPYSDYVHLKEGFFEHVFIHKKSEENSCRLKLNGTLIDLKLFNSNKVIVSWLEHKISKTDNHTKAHIDIIHIANCTVNNYIEYRFDFNKEAKFLSPLVFEDDTFDIFVASEDMCGTLGTCRISYDQFGRKINTSPFPKLFRTGKNYISTDGVFAYGYNDSKVLGAWHVDPAGKIVELMSEYVPSGIGLILSAASNARGFYSVCWSFDTKDDRSARCIQFDRTGKVLLNVTLPFRKSNQEYVSDVYNLAEGEILLTTSIVHEVEKYTREYEVRKIYADKKVGRPLSLDFKCGVSYDFFARVVSETSDDLTFYLACASQETGFEFKVQHVEKKNIV